MPVSKKPKRKALTKALERKVILEAGGKCPWCEDGKLKAAEAEIHHIDGDRSNNVLENLVLTCRNHHGQIEAQLIPHWEVMLKKTILSNPATMDRLGLVPQVRGENPSPSVVGRDNHGIAAKNIGTVYFKSTKGSSKISHPIGSVGADLSKKGYLAYLIRKYFDARRKGIKYGDTKPLTHAELHTTIETEFGAQTYFNSISRWQEICDFVKWRIDRTLFVQKALRGRAFYHSFEKHLEKTKPKVRKAKRHVV